MPDAGLPKQLDIVLDRTSPIPLYHQLAQAIEAAITCGELGPGDRLENELSITSRLGLARPTARQAIGELTRKGLVVRKRGVGTQVLGRQINRETRLSSLYDDLEAAGRTPRTQLLAYEIGRPRDEVLSCGAEVDPDSAFIVSKRLRLADGIPLAILVNHLPDWLRLGEDELATTPLYTLLQARGINLRVAHQTIGARLMSPEEARLLDEHRPAACLTALRIVYDDAGRLIEVGRHVYRASHYSLDVSLAP